MALSTLDRAVKVRALHIHLGRVVFAYVLSSIEQLLPIFIIHNLAENIVHVLSLLRQLSIQPLLSCEIRFIVGHGINRISRSVPKQLLNINQLFGLTCVDQPDRYQK